MNSVRENNWVRQYIVPVLTATAVMALIFLTVPMTGIPASVMGGYGGGGGPAVPGKTTTGIGTLSVAVPSIISVGTAGAVTMVISGADASNVDIASLTFAGAPVVSWSYDANGNLVLVFDKSKMNLKPGDTSGLLSGKFKDGTPFSGAVAVVVVQ
jgi:hypothetical protein